MIDHALNPAEAAAAVADAKVRECIDQNLSFRLEAGAGAGKTHSLIGALTYLIEKRGKSYGKSRRQIACITYTNVAKDEIDARTDRNPVIYSGTIHSFCWLLIQDFQPLLRLRLPEIPAWIERIAEKGPIGTRKIVYTLGHPKIEEKQVLLAHDDVLILMASLLPLPKFRRLLVERFPVLFVDEYQDTDAALAQALRTHVLGGSEGLVIGLFGDAWQKIYGNGCGAIEHPALHFIGKGANFRSAPRIVEALNHIRPQLTQSVRDPHGGGFVGVYHTNEWPGARRTGQHWGGDLQAENARTALEKTKTKLAADGWDLTNGMTKILILTHRVLAAEQGYAQLMEAFPFNDSFLKKEDAHIAFFANKIEPAYAAFEQHRYGAMFEALGANETMVKTLADKRAWAQEMEALRQLRLAGSIGDVLDFLKTAQRIPFPESLWKIDRDLQQLGAQPVEGETSACTRLRKMRLVPYSQVIALVQFIEGHTPFETKHGVKGAQFENVIVVFGRGWANYNFGQFLEWNGNPPANKADVYERNRNLFYVVCSRPKRRLALLFTQQLSADVITTLRSWFGAEAVHSLPAP